MPAIPAFCDNCGTAFPSGFFMDNCAEVTMTGCKSGPCPKCGSQGSVPDGVFRIMGNVIKILDAPRKTVEQFAKYTMVLHQARAENLDREQVKARIEEELPELSGLSSYLPKTRTELYAFLTLLLAFIATVAPMLKDDENEDVNIIINNTVEQVYQFSPSAIQPPKVKFPTPSRNDVCPCGSAEKYKFCCGQVI